ncbi:cell wall hydrolase [Phyllobacterium lublinensis]|uniref:cell wall hydrolase n=1 Tax=Phyllobacterium lublinensis TaxID=2875708 RepID=UPI001CCE3637|nr:cell wall hydrolase [Phyllobacterium sp. 2063]MBZ9654181.1 cell wall hydrolase [Phyllobacterium sp. 2063]
MKNRTNRQLAGPLIIGAAIFLLSPTTTAYQDMASLLSGSESGQGRWTSYLEKSPAGSIQKANMSFVDETAITAGVPASGVQAPGIGAIAINGSQKSPDATPDEDRINRSEKQGRIVSVSKKAPPKAFSAGSILQRSSMLIRPSHGVEVEMAFAKPKIAGKEIEIALAFHKRVPEKAKDDLPPMLASLVNNDQPDILALGYAPAAPDYSKTSPFDSILNEPKESGGRFIPQLGKGDHNWLATPLPPVVFTKEEQKCLATGIYFEARSESVKGQAAVAQVILNRVRNPAYPKTICKVVYQNNDWINRCQFSFACEGRKLNVTEPKQWKVAQEIAMAVTSGRIFLPEIGSATHYHAVYVRANWAHTMKRIDKIGQHIFYRTYGGGWI